MCKYCDISVWIVSVAASPKKEYAAVRHLHRTIDVPLQYTSYDESPDRECTKKKNDRTYGSRCLRPAATT